MTSGQHQAGVVTGKPLSVGGTKAHAGATSAGRGGVRARRVRGDARSTLPGRRAVIQGFGKVGGPLAFLLASAGMRVVAVSDVGGAVVNEGGLDPGDLADHVAATGSVAGFAGGDPIDPEAMYAVPCELFVPAALGGVITPAVAEKLAARLVVEAANGPTTVEAEPILDARGIVVVPDILANAGGVTASYFEWAQNRAGLWRGRTRSWPIACAPACSAPSPRCGRGPTRSAWPAAGRLRPRGRAGGGRHRGPRPVPVAGGDAGPGWPLASRHGGPAVPRLRRRQPLLRGHRRLHPPHPEGVRQAGHAVGDHRRQDAAPRRRADQPLHPQPHLRSRGEARRARRLLPGQARRRRHPCRRSATSRPSAPSTAIATPGWRCSTRRASRGRSCSRRWASAWRRRSGTTPPSPTPCSSRSTGGSRTTGATTPTTASSRRRCSACRTPSSPPARSTGCSPTVPGWCACARARSRTPRAIGATATRATIRCGPGCTRPAPPSPSIRGSRATGSSTRPGAAAPRWSRSGSTRSR